MPTDTIAMIRDLFAKGRPDHEVYDELVATTLYELSENIAKATAKDTDDPNEEDFRTCMVLDQVADAALTSSTFILADIDPAYTAETLASLLDAVENGVNCDGSCECGCHKDEEPTPTPNSALN